MGNMELERPKRYNAIPRYVSVPTTHICRDT